MDGAWVLPPYLGALWTPGYWGWGNGSYLWNPGYWGRTVGYYGGINYGFGYFGTGFYGGYWRSGRFFYNAEYNRFGFRNYNNFVYRQRIGGFDGRPGGVAFVRNDGRSFGSGRDFNRGAAINGRTFGPANGGRTFGTPSGGRTFGASNGAPIQQGFRNGAGPASNGGFQSNRPAYGGFQNAPQGQSRAAYSAPSTAPRSFGGFSGGARPSFGGNVGAGARPSFGGGNIGGGVRPSFGGGNIGGVARGGFSGGGARASFGGGGGGFRGGGGGGRR